MSLGQLLKRAFLSLVIKDDKQFPLAQATYNNKTSNVEILFPYGYCAVAPKGSLITMWNIMGQEENLAGMVNYPQKRFKGLKEGEVMLGNYLKGQYIKWDKDGDLHFYAKTDIEVDVDENVDVDIKGNTVIHIHGDLTIVVDGTSDVNIDASGTTVNLLGEYNLGGASGDPIARTGDATVCPAGVGHITGGSTHHKAT